MQLFILQKWNWISWISFTNLKFFWIKNLIQWMDHGSWVLWSIHFFIYKLIHLFIYSQRRVQNFLCLLIKQTKKLSSFDSFCVLRSFFAEWMHKSWRNCFYYVCLYHCMKEFSVNGEERLKTGHAHPLSGTLNFWGACPACTPNRITKLRPEH